MHGDENARDIARRLVQEAVSRAGGSLPARSDGPPVTDPEPSASDPGPPSPPTDAQRIAHRVVLEALAAEAEPTLKREPASEPDLPATPAATAAPAGPSVSLASAEAARRIVADALAAHDAQPQEPPEPPSPASPALQAAPAIDAEASWPTAGVDLLPVEPSAPAPAPTSPDQAAADPVPAKTDDKTDELTVQTLVVAPPPTFPTIGEPDVDAPLLGDPPTQVAWDDDTTIPYVPRAERLTLLDRWRARRHRKLLAAQWAPGATPQPRRTWRWVLATIIVALALGVLFPLTVAAFRSLFAL